MNYYIKAPGHAHWPAQSADIAEIVFGNRKAKLPVAGFELREIQGIQVFAYPIVPGSGFKLRVMAFCPVCNKLLALGRLYQHAKVHHGV